MLNSAQLSTNNGLGTQATSQNPQSSSASGSFGGNSISEVQPGTSNESLSTSQVGIPLIVNSLPIVSLNNSSTTVQTVVKPVVIHKNNPVMLGFAATLFIVAVIIFWSFSKQAKITTK